MTLIEASAIWVDFKDYREEVKTFDPNNLSN